MVAPTLPATRTKIPGLGNPHQDSRLTNAPRPPCRDRQALFLLCPVTTRASNQKPHDRPRHRAAGGFRPHAVPHRGTRAARSCHTDPGLPLDSGGNAERKSADFRVPTSCIVVLIMEIVVLIMEIVVLAEEAHRGSGLMKIPSSGPRTPSWERLRWTITEAVVPSCCQPGTCPPKPALRGTNSPRGRGSAPQCPVTDLSGSFATIGYSPIRAFLTPKRSFVAPGFSQRTLVVDPRFAARDFLF
jgi:hypothetical protein